MTYRMKKHHETGGSSARRFFCVLLSALFLLGSLSFPSGSLAQVENGVSYIDANGNEQTRNSVTVLAGGTTSWSGWYMVTGNLTIGGRITVNGSASLILCDGASLNAGSGISVTGANSLTVYGQSEGTGRLNARTSEKHNAGIGGDKNVSAGIITINGGSVSAAGGSKAAGIGGGLNGSGGTVTINGGTVDASGGAGAAGIGGGASRAGGSVTINGGTVTARGGKSAAGIGGGQKGAGGAVIINGGTVSAEGGRDGAGIGGGTGGSGGSIIIQQGTVTAQGGSSKKGAAGIGGGLKGDGGSVTISGGTVTATGSGKKGTGIGGGSGRTDAGSLSLYGMKVTAGSSAESAREITGGGWAGACRNKYAKLEPCEAHEYNENNVCIHCGHLNAPAGQGEEREPVTYKTADGSVRSCTRWEAVTSDTGSLDGGRSAWYVVEGSVSNGRRLSVSGSVNLILCDGASLRVGKGIRVAGGASLTIWAQSEGTGRLDAGTSAKNNAGIGGDAGQKGGTVTINGGFVSASGGENGAGIGGGYQGAGCRFTVNAGTVSASGGKDAAGIGGGKQGSGGTILINGGVVNATALKNKAAGMGGGYQGDGGEITINGGMVTANGGATSIGSGMDGASGGKIVINGGTVNATNNKGIGIGGYSKTKGSSGGEITINGGTVNAKGNAGKAPAIGAALSAAGARITINGGTVNATGGKSAPGIGGGGDKKTPGGVITINGGTVNATGGSYSAGIGGGKRQTGGTIIIRGGNIKAAGGKNAAAIGGGYKAYADRIVLGWTGQDDRIDATSFAAKGYEIEKAFHYETPDGQNKGEVTVGNLGGKNNNYLLVPDERENAEVTIEGGNRRVGVGESLQLTAAAAVPGPEGTGRWTWSSDDTDIAQVDENGIVTGVNTGVTQIRALYVSGSSVGEGNIFLAVGDCGQITLANTANGEVRADRTSALPQETVTLTAYPADGYRLAEITVICGEEEVETTATASGYTFIMPSGDVTVTALFCRYNLVTFVNWDGTVLKRFELETGTTPVYSEGDPEQVPEREPDEENSYIFAGWDPEVVPVTGDTVYTAVYDEAGKSYEIVFMNGDTVLQRSEVECGEMPEYEGEIPVDEDDPGKQWAGWEPELEPVSENAVYTAVFEVPSSALSIGENPISVGYWDPIVLPFVPEITRDYRFRTAGPLMGIWIYDGEQAIASGTEVYSEGEGYTVDCAVNLTAGRQYLVKINSYAGDAQTVLHIEAAQIYTIMVDNSSEHGHIDYCEATAYKGKTVEPLSVPEEGYAFKGLIITDEDGNTTEAEYDFIMPASNVTVKAVFEKMNRILFKLDDMVGEPIVNTDGRMWIWEDAKALPEATVTMLVYCMDGEHEIEDISVTTESGKAVSCYISANDENEYIMTDDESAWVFWFVMPDEPVFVRVYRTRDETEPERDEEPEFEGTSFVLPKDIRAIGESAFEGDKNIVTVDIPESCESIGENAFRGCSNLWQVRIPGNCQIDEGAFDGCGSVYIFGAFASPAYYYCLAHENCGFITVEP